MAAVLCVAVMAGTMLGTAMANASLAQAAESESGTVQHDCACGSPEGCAPNMSGDCGAGCGGPCHSGG
ncbi:MAG: hypothetical protein AB1700_09820 [Bacillota bacterium]